MLYQKLVVDVVDRDGPEPLHRALAKEKQCPLDLHRIIKNSLHIDSRAEIIDKCYPVFLVRILLLGGANGLNGLIGPTESSVINTLHGSTLIKDYEVVDSGCFADFFHKMLTD